MIERTFTSSSTQPINGHLPRHTMITSLAPEIASP